MSVKRFTADHLRESIDKANDDSASELDDSIELRCETEDEEAKEVENEESEIITASSIFIKYFQHQPLLITIYQGQ
jgi:hypothetical protein